MSEFKAFTEFTFDGKSSSSFGLTVVSDGSRYVVPMSPSFENRTTSIPGRPGLLYWGTDITEQTISIRVATANMSGRQYMDAKAHYSPGKVAKLSFSESPYAYYYAILSDQTSFSFVPFDKPYYNVRHEKWTKETIYKGEIELRFTTLGAKALSDKALATELAIDELFSWQESGLPYQSDFPVATNTCFIAQGYRIRNQNLVSAGTSVDGSSVFVYHAGNAKADTELRFSRAYTFNTTDGTISNWADIAIDTDKIKIIQPRIIADINEVLKQVKASFASWSTKKTSVMAVLRDMLDGSAKSSLLNLVNLLGTSKHPTLSSFYTAIRGGFFTGVTYTYYLNGFTKQSKLVVTGGSAFDENGAATLQSYEEDLAGSTNGVFLTLDPRSGPPSTAKQITFSDGALATNVRITFKNTYI